jgi:ribosomal protein L11 methyltransferase
MDIEITIQGPLTALKECESRLADLSPSLGPCQTAGSADSGDVWLFRAVVALNHLDPTLERVSREIARLEAPEDPGSKLDLRVRNLAYSEPPSGSDRYRDPFEPVPGLKVQPWFPALSPEDGKNSLIIDPGQSFGTGQHPTTRLSLLMVQDLEKDSWLQGKRVLDFGCGTGLLALAAVKTGAESALGVEIDPQGAAAARRNVELNDLQDRITVRQGSWDRAEGSFELILANLVASVHFRVGRELPGFLNPGGRAVLSGFSEDQASDMEARYMEWGLYPERSDTLDGWAVLVMRKTEA